MLLFAEKAGLPVSGRVSKIGEPFSSMGLADLVGTVSKFEPFDASTQPCGVALTRFNRDPLKTAFLAARSMLDWPFGFHRFLENIRNPASATLTDEFPGFVMKLRRQSVAARSAADGILLEELKRFSDHERRSDPHWAGVRSVHEMAKPVKGWIGMREACRRLASTSQTVRKLVEEGEIRARSCRVGSKTVTLVWQQDVEQLRTLWKRDRTIQEFKAAEGLLSVEHTAEYLGVAASSVMILVKASLIEHARRHPNVYVVKASVDRMLNRITSCVGHRAKPGRGAIRPWRAGGPSHVSIDRVVRAITEGRLPVHLAPGKEGGLRRLRADLDDVAKLAREVMPPPKPRLAPRRPQPRRYLLDPHMGFLEGVLDRKPHVTIAELRGLLAERGVSVSNGTVWNYLSRRGLTFDNRPQVRWLNGRQFLVRPRPRKNRPTD